MADQCDTCKFYRSRTAQIFECRYSDPTPFSTKGIWPTVLATDWCGKWVAIGATAAKVEYPPNHPAPGDLGSVPL